MERYKSSAFCSFADLSSDICLSRPDPSLIARPLPMPVDLWASGLVVPWQQTWTPDLLRPVGFGLLTVASWRF